MTYLQDSRALVCHAAEDGAAYRPPPRRRAYSALVLLGLLVLLGFAVAVAGVTVAANVTGDPVLCRPHAGPASAGDLDWQGAGGGVCTPRPWAILGRFAGIFLLSFSLGAALYVGALLALFLRTENRGGRR